MRGRAAGHIREPGGAICAVAQPATTTAFSWLAARRRVMDDYFGMGCEPVMVKTASDLDWASWGWAPASVNVYLPARMDRLP